MPVAYMTCDSLSGWWSWEFAGQTSIVPFRTHHQCLVNLRHKFGNVAYHVVGAGRYAA